MSTEAMRHELIEWISKLEDQGLLRPMLGFMKAAKDADWAEKLSPEERCSVERGLNDLEQGRSMSSKDLWARHGR
jgi:hypothetical protein